MTEMTPEAVAEEAEIRGQIGEHRAAISALIDRLLDLQPLPTEVSENKTLLGVAAVGESHIEDQESE